MVAIVDTGFADWLKAGALYVAVASPNAAAWAGKGVTTEIVSPYALKASATAEATKQAAFLAGPLVRDTVTVAGARKDLLAKPVTLKWDRLGYTAGGIVAFVVGAVEQANGTTVLNVVRSL